MAIDWGNILSGAVTQAVPAVFNYLSARDTNRTQAQIAKYQARAGGGLGMDTIMALITMGQTMGSQPGPSAPPAYQQQGGYYPGTSLLQMPTFQGQQLLAPTTQQAPYITPAIGTTTPTQAGWGDIVPYIGQQVYSWMTNGKATTNGGIATVPSVGELMNLPQVYTATAAGARAKSRIITVNPVTGSLTYFKNMGKPVLYSGDLAACKRVRRIAARANRAYPRKRTAVRRKR